MAEEFPENKEARIERQRALERIEEASSGVINLRRINDCVTKEKKRWLEVADYAGPVKGTDIPGKGRSLVTTEDVKKGSLLVVSKAISCAYADETDDVRTLYDLVDETVGRNAELLCKIGTIQALQANPQQAQDVYSLYAGKPPRDVALPDGMTLTNENPHNSRIYYLFEVV